MKACGRAEIQFHLLLHSALDEVECGITWSSHFPLRKVPPITNE